LQFYGYARAPPARAIRRSRAPADSGRKSPAGAKPSTIAPGVRRAGAGGASLLAEDRPALALATADREQEITAAHYSGTLAAWAAIRDAGEAYLALERHEEAVITLETLLDDPVREGSAATYALAHELCGFWKLGDHCRCLIWVAFGTGRSPQGVWWGTIATIQRNGQPAPSACG
jgi:hypothetical protein